MSIQDTLPKSRLTLRYKTEIDGQLANVELPLRLLAAGDFSNGPEGQPDFAKREIISFDGSNLDAVMADMDISVDIAESGTEQRLPINNMKSFTPGSIVDAVPALKEKEDKKNLLNGLLANINNSGSYRDAVQIIVDDSATDKELYKVLEVGYELIDASQGNEETTDEEVSEEEPSE